MAELVGTRVPRKEGMDKVRGVANYVDDLVREDMLHGVTVRSPVPRGRITGIRFEGNSPWDEIVVVTAKDLVAMGAENVVAMMEDDQPFLADERVNHAEEAVVLLAHPDKYVVEQARRDVHIDIAEEPAIFTIEEALAKTQVVWGDDNLQKAFLIDKGDVDSVWDSPQVHVIVEGEYKTGAQEQLYIEPNGMIAEWDDATGATIEGSLQCPYYIQKAIKRLFDLPEDKVRIMQATTGGGFGGKEEYPSMIAGHAVLLARKAGRPVKLIYDRAEDMVATTKRHPSQTKHRTALSKDGRILAFDVDFVIDGGAYLTLTPVVLSRGVIHAAGPYRCANTRIRGRAVATNLPPHGAFRGFGAPQSIFALERHIDKCAKAVGLDRVEFRRRNLLKRGDTTATGQVIEEAIDLDDLLDTALAKAGWAEKQTAIAAHNADPTQTVKRGLGLATFYHGSGFTGSGEVYLASVVHARGHADGTVEILAGSTEIGQGTKTVFSQIAAQAIDLPYDMIAVAQPDTAAVPDSGPTVASRTTMVVGKLVERAAVGIRDKLVQAGLIAESGYDAAQFAAACKAFIDQHGDLRSEVTYTPPPGIVWDDKTYTGSAYAAYGWAAYIAEVSVDTVTWQARVEDFVAVQDIGRVIHPVLAEGQVEGGVAQAIGLAIYEDVQWRQGRMWNNRMTNYIMPTSMDLPEIRVFFKEVLFEHGPSGAKGVGELPMDGPAPAIINAVSAALGVELDSCPAMPERIFEAMQASEAATEQGATA